MTIVSTSKNWKITGIKGLLLILVGLFTIAQPQLLLQTLANLIGLLALTIGIGISFDGWRNRNRSPIQFWTLFIGAVNIIFGIIVLMVPKFLISVLGLWILFDGLLQLITAYQLSQDKNKLWQLFGLSGAVSTLIGLLIISDPFGATVTFTVLMGVFLLVIGLMLSILAFRLKNNA